MFTKSSANAAVGGLKPPPAGRLRRANNPSSPAQHHLKKLAYHAPFSVRDTRGFRLKPRPKSEPRAAPVGTYYSDSEWPTMKPFAPATVAIAVLLFSGCSASEVITTGGDTRC